MARHRSAFLYHQLRNGCVLTRDHLPSNLVVHLLQFNALPGCLFKSAHFSLLGLIMPRLHPLPEIRTASTPSSESYLGTTAAGHARQMQAACETSDKMPDGKTCQKVRSLNARGIERWWHGAAVLHSRRGCPGKLGLVGRGP